MDMLSSNSIRVGWQKRKKTRASTNELNYLRDAQKMKIVLINQDDGTEVVQTVGSGGRWEMIVNLACEVKNFS